MLDLQRLQDWWRGYGEEDVCSLVQKLNSQSYTGAVVPVSSRELRALRDGAALQYGDQWRAVGVGGD